MTRPGIEPRSPGPWANALPTSGRKKIELNRNFILFYLYIHLIHFKNVSVESDLIEIHKNCPDNVAIKTLRNEQNVDKKRQ